MAKTELTKEIEKAIFTYSKAHKLGVYGCYEVAVGKGYGNEYCDFMTMTSENIFTCYEIKVSIPDFNSKAKLSWHGDRNYYVLTHEVWEYVKTNKQDNLLRVGVIVYNNNRLEIVKKSPRQTLTISDRVMLMHCMVRSASRYVTKTIMKIE